MMYRFADCFEDCISRQGLQTMADGIMALDIPEKDMVHAEKMDSRNADEYSLAFYEVAEQLMGLMITGSSLEDGVRTLAGKIPPVEQIYHALKWEESIDPDRSDVTEFAIKIAAMNTDGPDMRIAKRVLSKKASADEWKLAALRYADLNNRTDCGYSNLAECLKDIARCEKEVAILRKHYSRVTIHEDKFIMKLPVFPPWTDVGNWHDDWAGRGFGRMHKSDVISKDDSSLAHRSVSGKGSRELEPDKYQAAFSAQMGVFQQAKDGVNEQIPGGKTGNEAGADVVPALLVSDGQNKVSGENSSLLVKDVLNIEWPSLAAKSLEPKMQPSHDKGKVKLQNPSPNAWNERAKKKSFMNAGIAKNKSKLKYKPPDSAETECLIDIARAYSTKEVWGYALLGQYVGRHPGHSAIIGMMNSWETRAKYKEEQGWMIFNFESEEEQEKVLLGGPYLIQGRPLILKHVPDKFAFTNKDFATVPLWIRIHGLGTRFWTEEFLGNIASYVGKPLYLDPVTEGRKRHSYARVLVEINLATKVVRKVPLRFSDGDHFVCQIKVENEPKFCHTCCAFGHNDSECQFLSKIGGATGVNKNEPAVTINTLPAEHKTANKHVFAAVSKEMGVKDNTADATDVDIVRTNTAITRSVQQQFSRSMEAAETQGNQQKSDLNGSEDETTPEVVTAQVETMTNEANDDNKKQEREPAENDVESQGLICAERTEPPGPLQLVIGPLKGTATSGTIPPSAALVHHSQDAGPNTRSQKKGGKGI